MSKRFHPSYIIPLLIAIIIILFLVRGLKENPRLLPSTLINKPTPAFALRDLNSSQLWSQSIFQGQYNLLVVWASWCDTCKDEAGYLMQFHQNHPDIQIVGLNYKDNPDAAKAWLQQYGNPFQMVLEDTDGSTAINFGVYGTPETFLIGPHGTILAKHVGVFNPKAWADDLKPIMDKDKALHDIS